MHSHQGYREPDTIVVESQGGIGNQLFIYAFARELQSRSQFPVALDLWRHKLPNARPFQISQIIGRHLTVVDSSSVVPNGIRQYALKLRHWSQRMSSHQGPGKGVVRERSLSFDPQFLSPPPGARLTGYFQSFKYFTSVAEDIRQEILSVRDDALRQASASAQQSSTAIHVRLGDFQFRRHRKTHATLTPEYYIQSLHQLGLTDSPHVLTIFSDEPGSAQRMLLESLPPVEMRIHRSMGSDLLDLFMMSTFHQIICANSSFSWWSAWLSGNPGARITVPRNWIHRRDFVAKDLLPPAWTLVSDTYR